MKPLADLFGDCDAHRLALSEAMARCPRPFAADHFAVRKPELVAAIDQFAYRFAKLQDTMSTQLFRRFAVDALAEPAEAAPVVDLLNLLERYGFLPSVLRWQEIRQMRNQITHEYSMNPAELAITLELAFAMVSEMSDLIDRLRQAAIRHRAIPA